MSAPFIKVPPWIVYAAISPRAKMLYIVLRDHVNNSKGETRPGWLNGYAWPSQERLAVLTGLADRRSVSRVLRELVELGAVVVVRAQTKVSGRPARYFLRDEPPDGYAGLRDLADYARLTLEPELDPDVQAPWTTGHENDSPTVPSDSNGTTGHQDDKVCDIGTTGTGHEDDTLSLSGSTNKTYYQDLEPDLETKTDPEKTCSPDGERALEADAADIRQADAEERVTSAVPTPPSVVESKEADDGDESGSTPLPLPSSDAYWLVKGQEGLKRLKAGRNSHVYDGWTAENVARGLRLAFDGNPNKRQWCEAKGLGDLIQAPQLSLMETA